MKPADRSTRDLLTRPDLIGSGMMYIFELAML